MTSEFRIYFSAAVCRTLTGTQWISFSTMGEIIGWLSAPGSGSAIQSGGNVNPTPTEKTNRKENPNVYLRVSLPRPGERRTF